MMKIMGIAVGADDVNEALNEATVAGFRQRPDGSIMLLIHVLALPERGSVDLDIRRH